MTERGYGAESARPLEATMTADRRISGRSFCTWFAARGVIGDVPGSLLCAAARFSGPSSSTGHLVALSRMSGGGGVIIARDAVEHCDMTPGRSRGTCL